MIRVYLEKMRKVESGELSMLTQALAASTIDTEVDQVTAGLLAFTSMSLQSMDDN